MDQAEFIQACAALGVKSDVTPKALERAYLQKNFALVRNGTPEEREQMRVHYERLSNHLRAQPGNGTKDAGNFPTGQSSGRSPDLRPVPPLQPRSIGGGRERLDPFSFDSRMVNIVALPSVAFAAWLISLTPLAFFLRGFQVWMHEFGHATVAWLIGKRALPLPIGWTNVEGEKSPFVYFGVLFLLAILSVAGWKERKIWPVLIALAIAPLQFYMTWRMPEYRTDLWLNFGGVGGEFYLSTLLMVAFYFEFPDKFKWGACRYFFLFLGASSFLNIHLFWLRVKHGSESIPWGSMIHGEEDGGGDMNVLRDVYHWSNHEIVHAYTHLGSVCLAILAAVYLIFAFRLDRLSIRLLTVLWPE